MKKTTLTFLAFFSTDQHCIGIEKLNDRLPPIEFVFINCASPIKTIDTPLTSLGIQEAIQAGRVLRDFSRPYIVCGESIALKETSKFLAEELGLIRNDPGYSEANSQGYGHYHEINIDPILDTLTDPADLRDQIMDLIKNNYSHERVLFLVSNKNIFDLLQKDLTDSNIDIKEGDVCIFMPVSNKKWKIDYRPSGHSC